MAAVFGVALAASVLAGIGAWRGSSRPMLVAAALFFAETVLLFFGLSIAFPLTLAVAILFLVAGLRWRSRSPPRPSP
jgi:hypothetical protein